MRWDSERDWEFSPADGEALGDDAPTTSGETQHVNGSCCLVGDDRDRAVQAGVVYDRTNPENQARWWPFAPT